MAGDTPKYADMVDRDIGDIGTCLVHIISIGAELASPHRSRRNRTPIATPTSHRCINPRDVPKICQNSAFPILLCFARFFPWTKVNRTATSSIVKS